MVASICMAACSFAVYWLCVTTATLSCRCRCSVTPSDLFPTLGSRRSSGLVVSALDLKSSLALTTSWICSRYSSPWFNSLSLFVHSQLVCLLSVGVLNLLSPFVVFCCYSYTNTSAHDCQLPSNLPTKLLLLLLLLLLLSLSLSYFILF